MNFKLFFHYISYLQYPLMLVALYFTVSPYLSGIVNIKENPNLIFEKLNNSLLFFGLGISFSSLQDTSKTQNKFSKKIWENPKKGRFVIITLCLSILIYLIMGIIGFFSTKEGILKDLSVGLIVLALGMFGLLKAAVEMFEYNRIDKNNFKE